MKAREDLPDQLTPVRTVSVFLVKDISTLRRLCVATQKRSIVLDIEKSDTVVYQFQPFRQIFYKLDLFARQKVTYDFFGARFFEKSSQAMSGVACGNEIVYKDYSFVLDERLVLLVEGIFSSYLRSFFFRTT